MESSPGRPQTLGLPSRPGLCSVEVCAAGTGGPVAPPFVPQIPRPPWRPLLAPREAWATAGVVDGTGRGGQARGRQPGAPGEDPRPNIRN